MTDAKGGLPPKPASRPGRVSLWRYMRLFRRDILSAQPERLYRAWMAEFRTPFFRSFLINQPDLIEEILKTRPMDFPKSDRVGEGLRPLLGQSVFLTNGETWARQRRIIDPAFEGGRLREVLPEMQAAGLAAVDRMSPGVQDIEPAMSHAAADVIFRTLFSIPIEDEIATGVYRQFRAYQRSQPILNAAAFLPLPRWVPRGHRAGTLRAARAIRTLIGDLTRRRVDEIAAGNRARRSGDEDPDRARPGNRGRGFQPPRWSTRWRSSFLPATRPVRARFPGRSTCWRVIPSGRIVWPRSPTRCLTIPGPGDIARLTLTRDVFREALRLYPPVPMMVREARCAGTFRGRPVRAGAQVVISPWHLHRHQRLWDNPGRVRSGALED